MDNSPQQSIYLSISAVERDTGLSKDTLRVWERRYGFPRPDRDHFGERIYPAEQVDRLRVIRRLMDAGHRPGKIMALDDASLQQLTDRLPQPQAVQASEPAADSTRLMELIRSHQVPELRRELGQRLMRLGLERFVVELVAPLIERVGDSWARGQLEIYEEHLFTESMQVVLRGAIGTIPTPQSRPKVLLTTFPGEPHGMGLLMVEALLAIEGCQCVSLGTQTPIWDIVLASRAQQVDAVVLSFSAAASLTLVSDGLSELRTKLPPEISIWAGGRNAALGSRRLPAGILQVAHLIDVQQVVKDWRRQHRPSSSSGSSRA